MPPQKAQISCPRCHRPAVATIEQLFDVTSDPGAKQRLLGGVSNYAVCQSCGYNGPLATPIVYHDADKELLLTYFPPELNLPVNEQEKLVGPLITQVTNRLPPEKRKAYLLRPQNFLTYQSLIERILSADGITPEMIQEQQKRVAALERLLGAATPEERSEIIKQESAVLDASFFALFSRLLESASASGQEQVIAQMSAIQQQLLTETEYGRKIVSQANEVQEAIKTLQAAGKGLTREKLLEILIAAPNDDRLNALVSMTRPGLDYLFFQTLTERIESKKGEERKKLESLRDKLLDITHRIDQQMEEEFKQAEALLNTLLAAEDIEKATAEHLEEINETFIHLLDRAMQEANQKNDAVRMPKLQKIASVLQQASAPPPELQVLDELLQAPDEAALNELLEKNKDVVPQLTSIIASILGRQGEQEGNPPQGEDAQLMEKLQQVYRAALKFSMKKNLTQ